MNETVADLTRALEQRGVTQPEWRVENARPVEEESGKRLLQQAQLKARGILRAADAKAQAHIERAKQDAAEIVAKARRQSSAARADPGESAEGIAASIAVLKAQLAEVDAKILAATSDLQKATDGIAAALNDTDQSLSAWNVQTKTAPAAAPAARPQPETPVRPTAGPSPAPAQQPGFYENLQREEEAYYHALRRVQYEDALRRSIYEEELRRARKTRTRNLGKNRRSCESRRPRSRCCPKNRGRQMPNGRRRARGIARQTASRCRSVPCGPRGTGLRRSRGSSMMRHSMKTVSECTVHILRCPKCRRGRWYKR